MELSAQEMLELAQFAFARMDGAWFLALARELGIEPVQAERKKCIH